MHMNVIECLFVHVCTIHSHLKLWFQWRLQLHEIYLCEYPGIYLLLLDVYILHFLCNLSIVIFMYVF